MITTWLRQISLHDSWRAIRARLRCRVGKGLILSFPVLSEDASEPFRLGGYFSARKSNIIQGLLEFSTSKNAGQKTPSK